MSAAPLASTHASALHPSEVHATTGADGHPILTTGPMTPSLDFDPKKFSAGQTGGAQDSGAHANPHPVVAKSGIDLSTGVTRPAETHANSGTFESSSTGTGSAEPSVTGLRQRAGSISNTVGAKVNAVTSNVGEKLNTAGSNVSAQVQHAAEHPAVQNAKQAALKQTDSFRETLGRYPIIVNAEKRTGVDRVALVIGGVFLYLLLIPLNLFGLALPTTQLLTFLPPTFLALRTLDSPNEERTKTLLSYFVVFGFVQFAESLMAGFLERKIPQYYTVKLIFLAYLIHPKTKGARKIHSSVLRPLLARAQQVQKSADSHVSTPPTTKPSSGATVNSPSFPTSDIPSARTSGFTNATSNSTSSGAPAGYGVPPSSAQGSTLGGSGAGQIHLPSGSGTGVGQEVPKY